jgi:hypothetical protein
MCLHFVDRDNEDKNDKLSKVQVPLDYLNKQFQSMYKVVQIWPGQTVTSLHTLSPGHIWTTVYIPNEDVATETVIKCYGGLVFIQFSSTQRARLGVKY